MKLELIRQYQIDNDKVELLFEIDGEFLETYREWSGDYEITEKGFSQFINERIEDELHGDGEWRHEDE
jgi:hypothetical protein